jgi:ketosteroid isomerase-like protein
LTAWWVGKTMVRFHRYKGGIEMAHPDEDLVRGAFAAFGRGDLDALRDQYLAEDVRFHYPGRGALAGDHDGVPEVLAVFGRAFELTGGTLHLELHDVIASDEHAVALYTARGERAGRRLEDRTVQVWHIRDRKAAEVWVYPEDLYVSDEFWS